MNRRIHRRIGGFIAACIEFLAALPQSGGSFIQYYAVFIQFVVCYNSGEEGIFISLNLVICAFILIACIISSKLSNRIGVPVLAMFILLGMLFGSDGIFGIAFDDYRFAEQFCSVALIFIMFYGGFGTNWNAARPVALRAALLSSLGVAATALLTGLFCHYALGVSLLEGLLIGAVISSTDAASVFSILRSQRLNLKHNLASLLEIESGSNDPTAYMMTVIILGVMATGQADSFGYMLFAQIGIGLCFGFIAARLGIFALEKLSLENQGLHTIFVMAVALLSYALPSLWDGNGYLSVYITGIVMGNHKIRRKIELVHFFDGFTWMTQFMLFFMIGLLSFPSQLPDVIGPAVLITLFLTFVARPIAVFSILSWFKVPVVQQLLVAWAGLRGAASIVFAIYAVVGDIYTKHDIFHIVFCVALLSVTIQGTFLPIFARKLKLVDDGDSVMKTFNDYQEEQALSLIEISVEENHPWSGRPLKEKLLPSEFIVVMIKRGKNVIVPNGDTVVKPADILVLNALNYEDDSHTALSEQTVSAGNPWINQAVSALPLPPKTLIVLVKRGESSIVPRGDTVIESGDVLVLLKGSPARVNS